MKPETPEQVVERELALWRLSQRDPDIMNGETPEEAERRRAYMTELQEVYRRDHDRLMDMKRQWEEQLRARDRELRDRQEANRRAALESLYRESEMLYLERYEKQRRRDAQLTKAFPRITWRDIWRALW